MAEAMSFGVLNYSGMLFNHGNTKTPLSSMIGGRQKVTDHVEYAMGQEYTAGGGSQPAISESASLTAPAISNVTRTQQTNVCQIYQESVGVSYAKQSNMGTLSGINVANQVANPINELDFQIAAKMQKIANDIEYTFINGTYNKATSDTTINKTRGLVAGITTNAIAVGNKELGIWKVAEGLEAIHGQHADTEGLVLLCDAKTLFQLNSDAVNQGMLVPEANRELGGIAMKAIMTPLGIVYLALGEYLPSGTALLLNVAAIAPVHMMVPGKGNFFYEELAKSGAGEKGEIFGQIGIDYSMEWLHAKFTGIATTFTAPAAKKVVVAGGNITTSA